MVLCLEYFDWGGGGEALFFGRRQRGTKEIDCRRYTTSKNNKKVVLDSCYLGYEITLWFSSYPYVIFQVQVFIIPDTVPIKM